MGERCTYAEVSAGSRAVYSAAYDYVWDTFTGIGLCQQIQSRPECEQTDKHIMIIGPEDYGADYTDEYITIYADSGIVKARFKGDEIWYSVPKDLVAICRKLQLVNDKK